MTELRGLRLALVLSRALLAAGCGGGGSAASTDAVVNHRSTLLSAVPAEWITRAASSLHIAYGQLVGRPIRRACRAGRSPGVRCCG
jgi:hypothetical protein